MTCCSSENAYSFYKALQELDDQEKQPQAAKRTKEAAPKPAAKKGNKGGKENARTKAITFKQP